MVSSVKLHDVRTRNELLPIVVTVVNKNKLNVSYVCKALSGELTGK